MIGAGAGAGDGAVSSGARQGTRPPRTTTASAFAASRSTLSASN